MYLNDKKLKILINNFIQYIKSDVNVDYQYVFNLISTNYNLFDDGIKKFIKND